MLKASSAAVVKDLEIREKQERKTESLYWDSILVPDSAGISALNMQGRGLRRSASLCSEFQVSLSYRMRLLYYTVFNSCYML